MSDLILFHRLDESLDLCWDCSVLEQIQAVDVREMTTVSSVKVILKRKGTYEVFAPDAAMLKPFCKEPTPLEKPFKEGLNIFKMSEERKIKKDQVKQNE